MQPASRAVPMACAARLAAPRAEAALPPRSLVAAAVEEAAGRAVDLTHRGAMIDPVVSLGPLSDPLLRSEGHGLRELVVLLAAIYRPD